MDKKRKTILFLSESIRRDNHRPLVYFKKYRCLHLYIKAPYGDMIKEDFVSSEKVKIHKVFARIRKESPDVLQGVEPFGSKIGFILSVISYYYALTSKVKLVSPVYENRPIHEKFSLFQRILLRLFCPMYLKRADVVIPVTNKSEEIVKSYYSRAKIDRSVIWGSWGIDTDEFRPLKEKERGLLVYVGKLIQEKGLKYMLEGFSGALEEVKYLKLNIVGDGPYKHDMETIIKMLKIDRKVKFIGLVPNKEVPRYMSEAELCLYPSYATKKWAEQTGLVNFQALSCGTPLLTTDSGGNPEYIKDGEGAMIVHQRNSEEIESSIIKFFTDETYKNDLTDRARKYVRRFDSKIQIGKAENLLDKIFNED